MDMFAPIEYQVINGQVRQVEAAQLKFNRLRDIWLNESDFSMPLHFAYRHQAYRDIIHMGEKVIPLLLDEIERNHPRKWLWALYVASGGEDPVPEESSSDVPEIRRCWLEWGVARGYRK